MAIPAFAAKQEPADDRNVVVGFDSAGALRTAGAGRHDRRAFRNPRDADVQEAADDESEEKKGSNGHIFTVAQPEKSLNYAEVQGCPMANGREPAGARVSGILDQYELA